MGRFDGAVALVTGASRGIGFSGAERLVSEGARVVIEPAAMRKIIEINVISALTRSKDAVAAGLAKNGGSIVTIASIAGLTASPGIGFYGGGSIRPLT